MSHRNRLLSENIPLPIFGLTDDVGIIQQVSNSLTYASRGSKSNTTSTYWNNPISFTFIYTMMLDYSNMRCFVDTLFYRAV